ncbi:protein TIC 20-II, chloroplastic-like [Papaver somniferum]|uniref:protein TIC 20-II, chloroplastic-like n=1 Tax=Papaver somniferum TaxID=3469 RepID=UPI000E6F5B2D|nr:protein TIC 20-II, chloroplastic-like [Papaver somniferum]
MASSSSSPSSSGTISARDRLVSALVYIIPFLNGLNYGTYLFAKYPLLELVFDPIVPLLSFYKPVPSVGLFAFLTLYIGIVRDRNFSRFVRFNSLQAMVLDFMLVVPSLARTILVNADPFAEEIGLKFQLLKVSHDVTFIVIVLAFLYAFSRCVLGRIPEFPGITNAVEWQIFAVDRQL